MWKSAVNKSYSLFVIILDFMQINIAKIIILIILGEKQDI